MKKVFLAMAFLMSFFTIFAQGERVEMADAMRSNGKIYVVVGVLLIILIGLFIYLFSMDKKIRKIEQATTLKN